MTVDGSSLLIVALAAILGFAFTIVPVLPGGIFPLAALAAVGATEGWRTVPVWTWITMSVLLVLYVLVDNLAQLLGVQRLGGSRRAMAVGALGVVVGPLLLAPLLGPLALVLGPPIGAIVGTIVGERSSSRRAGQPSPTVAHYRRLGTGALVAFVLGTFAKLGLVTMQVGLLAWLLL